METGRLRVGKNSKPKRLQVPRPRVSAKKGKHGLIPRVSRRTEAPGWEPAGGAAGLPAPCHPLARGPRGPCRPPARELCPQAGCGAPGSRRERLGVRAGRAAALGPLSSPLPPERSSEEGGPSWAWRPRPGGVAAGPSPSRPATAPPGVSVQVTRGPALLLSRPGSALGPQKAQPTPQLRPAGAPVSAQTAFGPRPQK